MDHTQHKRAALIQAADHQIIPDRDDADRATKLGTQGARTSELNDEAKGLADADQFAIRGLWTVTPAPAPDSQHVRPDMARRRIRIMDLACPVLCRGLQPRAHPDRNRLLPRPSDRLPQPAAASAMSSSTAGSRARSERSARRSQHLSAWNNRIARPLAVFPRQAAPAASMSTHHPWLCERSSMLKLSMREAAGPCRHGKGSRWSLRRRLHRGLAQQRRVRRIGHELDEGGRDLGLLRHRQHADADASRIPSARPAAGRDSRCRHSGWMTLVCWMPISTSPSRTACGDQLALDDFDLAP